jgi:BirA family biotin operon repressor/biotin-[acetyl-CoA-carboxylase] ligase
MQSELDESAVQSALTTRWLGRDYRYFPAIGSTNETLRAMLEAGDEIDPAAGLVLLAGYQNEGKGRLDRRWLAPPDTSLLLSILFRPGWPGEQSQWLTMLASLAAAEAMESLSQREVFVKWPNDLVIKLTGSWHKVSGLLLEGSVNAANLLESAILGIGMNVNIPEEALPTAIMPAASLLVAAGHAVDRLKLLVDFLRRLEGYYEAADAGWSPQPAWKARLINLGQPVVVTHAGRQPGITGVAEDTNDWGQLLVRDEHGLIQTVSAGDVTLREAKP